MKKVRRFLVPIYYNFLDLLTKKNGIKVKINDFAFNLPAHYYRYHPKDYEKNNFDFFRQRATKEMTCLDIGAHIGIYAVFMSKYADATVYSFEPTPQSRQLLQRTITMNKRSDKIFVVPKAVSEASGKATFYIDRNPLSEANSLVNVDLGEDIERNGYEVQVVSIDEFVQEKGIKVNFIKIDAEGVELEILKGAKTTFTTNRPSGILGIHPFAYNDRQKTMKSIWQTMQEYNLQVFHDGEKISEGEFCAKTEIFDLQFIPV
jgi:FkbM family methyltransferase